MSVNFDFGFAQPSIDQYKYCPQCGTLVVASAIPNEDVMHTLPPHTDEEAENPRQAPGPKFSPATGERLYAISITCPVVGENFMPHYRQIFQCHVLESRVAAIIERVAPKPKKVLVTGEAPGVEIIEIHKEDDYKILGDAIRGLNNQAIKKEPPKEGETAV